MKAIPIQRPGPLRDFFYCESRRYFRGRKISFCRITQRQKNVISEMLERLKANFYPYKSFSIFIYRKIQAGKHSDTNFAYCYCCIASVEEIFTVTLQTRCRLTVLLNALQHSLFYPVQCCSDLICFVLF